MQKPIKYPLYVSPVRFREGGQQWIGIVDANEEMVLRIVYSPHRDQQDRADADRLVRFANAGALMHHLVDQGGSDAGQDQSVGGVLSRPA